ncbi:MFS transporter [Saccharomonospora piscinae]|uniref:MFS transporter n=1 Tax=Saccharomonospora piscinae TaxID=687388 RepID=A0A1V9A5A5_SACPI|nr:MFS transporter [Saccharomonospora piscinae]OQO92216.1 MFS transporter [Saccharomonospora piscinae]
MLVLVLACAAQFLVVLDVSIVTVALPSMEAQFELGAAGALWIVNAYVLVFAGLLLAGGRVADLVGHRRAFLTGATVFTVASLVGGLAPEAGVVVAARAGQGLGAAVLAPVTLTILTTTVPEGTRRHRALAVWTAVGLAGGTTGNLIGGVLTEYLSWRWVFLGNVPLGVVAVLLAVRALPPDAPPRRRDPVDVRGTLLATVGLVALTFGIVRAGTHGWNSPPTLAALGVAVAALAVFAVVERRYARVPLLPPRLLATRSVARGNVVLLLAGACLNPMWYFLTFAMQDVLRLSPLETGLGFVPYTLLTIAVGVRLTPWLMRHVAARTLIVVGAGVAAAGFGWQAGVGPGMTYAEAMLGPAVLIAVGGGLLNTPLTAVATSGVRHEDAGAASGLLNTTKQVGGALGLAAWVTVAGADLGLAFHLLAGSMLVTALAAMALPTGAGHTGRHESLGRVTDDASG